MPTAPTAPAPTAAATVRAALRGRPHSTVLVDFDETLWLRSSTEAYLASLRPRLLAVLVLAAVDLLRPWTLLPGPRARHVYRDWLRVLLATAAMPWGLARWRRTGPALGREWQNRELLDALADAGPLHVVTFGFRPVVAPLLHGIEGDVTPAVCGGLLRGYRVRRAGKLAEARRALGADAVAGALVVSDSEDDADLLAACRTPVLVQWPGARCEKAFRLPGWLRRAGRSGASSVGGSVPGEQVPLGQHEGAPPVAGRHQRG